jgi:hypothetical protein
VLNVDLQWTWKKKIMVFNSANPCEKFVFGLYLDAFNGHLDSKKCDASIIIDMHIWMLLFVYDFILRLESEVGLQQQLDTL